MHISREETLTHTIQAYGENQLKINAITYDNSLIVSADSIISPWALSAHTLDLPDIESLLTLKPEVILVGHHKQRMPLTAAATQALVDAQIGIEIMSTGAACRTFNLLLQENRRVVLGVVFNK